MYMHATSRGQGIRATFVVANARDLPVALGIHGVFTRRVRDLEFIQKKRRSSVERSSAVGIASHASANDDDARTTPGRRRGTDKGVRSIAFARASRRSRDARRSIG
jgi:hypothetical protein